MSQINPFSGYVAGATQVQRQQAAQKDSQLRRIQQLAKDVALQDDQLEHQVESSEEVTRVREEADEDPRQRKRKGPESNDEPPRLDVTA